MPESNVYKVIIDSISAHVAILDEQGIILITNRAWENFACENGMGKKYQSIGKNYIAICRAASSHHEDDDAGEVSEGIQKVLSGGLQEFFTHYPCHSPEKKRWYTVRVVPFNDKKMRRAIVTHENITPLIEVQRVLQQKEIELLRERARLEETNVALRVLLRQRDEDKSRIEEAIYTNVDHLVLPYVGQLLTGKLSAKQKNLAEVIDANLRDIISPFLRSLNNLDLLLTPREIEVAHLVRSGRTSKEITEVLGLSVSGVDFHRKRLRQKLGLTHSAANLRSYLLSLEGGR